MPVIPMTFRFPDDPIRVSKEELSRMDEEMPGTWIAQAKSDGWRRPGYLMNGDVFPDGCPLCPSGSKKPGRHWHFFAKRGGGEEASRQPPVDLVEELSSLAFPDNVAFDMEWMGPRMVDVLNGLHEFRIFDIQYLEGKWLGGLPFPERYAKLRTLFAAAQAAGRGSDRVRLVDVVDSGLVRFFDAQVGDPLSEGVVLRHGKSRLIGDLRGARDNPLWRKVKYRDIKERALI